MMLPETLTLVLYGSILAIFDPRKVNAAEGDVFQKTFAIKYL